MAEAGTQFGRYELRGELGRGGFATVFRAWDVTLGREVALKALQTHLALDATIRQRFMAEARAIAQLHHPNIITVHEVDEASGRPFFTMELINGPTLSALVAPGQGLPLGRVAEIMRGLASAVDYLHTRRLVHRDIKASNVMLDAWGRVVLMDFGVARALDQTQLTQSGISIGTPEAMAPEQVRGQPAGPAADVYAIGVLAYRLLAGRAPFVGETIYVLHAHAYEPPPALSELRPGLPESVYAAIDAALAKAPDDRPISAEQFAGALSVPSSETTMGDTTARFVRLPSRPAGEPRTPTPEPARSGPPPSVTPPAEAPVRRQSEPQAPAYEAPGAPAAAPRSPSQPANRLGSAPPPELAATQLAGPPRPAARQESAAGAPAQPPRRSEPDPPPATEVVRTLSEPPGGAPARKRGLPWLLIGGIVALLVIAGVVTAIVLANGSKKNTAANTAGSPTGTATAAPAVTAAGGASAGGAAVAVTTTTAATVGSTVTSSASAAVASASARPASATVAPTAAPAVVALFTGSGQAGYAEGKGDQAQFSGPQGVAVDGSGTVFVADSGNNRIRKIAPDGTTSLLAGPAAGVTATLGLADGAGDAARFDAPRGIAVDRQGNVYVADTSNHRIRKIAPDGRTSIFAGNPNVQVETGLGGGGLQDGPGAQARFNSPTGLAIDGAGNLYVADSGNNRIRKIAPDGTVSTLAGSGQSGTSNGGYADGKGDAARFNGPSGVAVDAAGNVFVSDTNNNLIRKIAPDGTVTTFAGVVQNGAGVQGSKNGAAREATFAFPSGIAVDGSGNIYVGDRSNHQIRRIAASGAVTTVAGSTEGFADGSGTSAKFDFPGGLALDGNGILYVADSNNNRIRKITVK